jgi:hypothetical protein
MRIAWTRVVRRRWQRKGAVQIEMFGRYRE